ncbi:hypothetical protein KC644_00545 [Candidatus Berkelbacteria bacterium]|nr:hypothetical protein [Candidatus Berkelbacteria bacterium]
MSAKIVPAVLSRNKIELDRDLKKIVGLADLIHLDIADGEFVDLSTPTPADFPVIEEKTGLFWHLMVKNPAEYVEQIARAKIVAVHAEAQFNQQTIDDIKRLKAEPCLVLNPETSVNQVKELVERFNFIQVMTVELGAQGRNFLFDQLEKITELERLWPDKKLIIDGGVGRATIEVVAKYKLDLVVVGSGIMQADDPADEQRILQRLLDLG